MLSPLEHGTHDPVPQVSQILSSCTAGNTTAHTKHFAVSASSLSARCVPLLLLVCALIIHTPCTQRGKMQQSVQLPKMEKNSKILRAKHEKKY